ncbi:hypothetical protein OS493_013631 [Desmophyllum pertusum]|uniref:Uncharacterized protein n=1 Tax=Desmophyllum pertusum TaxID=174260 RepID=A0A9X0A2M1_9CNID|nr:hypothetical protein OS493_013631 [Desmophyllum pertusum]
MPPLSTPPHQGVTRIQCSQSLSSAGAPGKLLTSSSVPVDLSFTSWFNFTAAFILRRFFSFLQIQQDKTKVQDSLSGGLIKETKTNLLPPNSTSQGKETGTKCNILNCSFAIDTGEGDKFKELIFQENALAIFMFVNVGNATVREQKARNFEQGGGSNNVSYDLQLKQKWAWLRNQRGRFLATLPYDFDILSLTTLKRDAFSVTLGITSTPLNCYSNLSQNCLDSLIATTIIDSLSGSYGNVCVRAVHFKEGDSVIDGGYRCCERKNDSVVCDKPIENNQWIEVALRLLWASSIGFGLFAPLLFKYLPKEFKKGPRIRPKAVFARKDSEIAEAETASVDLTSPSTRPVLFALDGGMLDVLRTQTESVFFSRLSRCLFVILLSCVPLLQGFIYAYLKKGGGNFNWKIARCWRRIYYLD